MRILLLLAGIALATPSLAGSTTEPNKSDHRKDYTESMFEKMDTDQDGNISKQEYEASLQKRLEKGMTRFNMMDGDNNGSVSKTEAMEAKMRMKAEWKEKRRTHCNQADS